MLAARLVQIMHPMHGVCQSMHVCLITVYRGQAGKNSEVSVRRDHRTSVPWRSKLEQAVLLLQVMLGVDRLDMIKGIPQKLLAFEKFLEEHPEWRDKVLLVQIAVPSRTDVPEYQVCPSHLNTLTPALCIMLRCSKH